MGASHTKRPLDTPWKRPMGAPPKLRPLDASMERPVGALCKKRPLDAFNKHPVGATLVERLLDASMERPMGALSEKRPLDGLVPIVQRALHQGCVQRTLSKRLLDAFTKKHPVDEWVYEKPAPWCNSSGGRREGSKTLGRPWVPVLVGVNELYSISSV
ncbi:hypothetical protein PCANC_19067 [Puccinia coronata f. sp. avenae]|uniref:Uncharacterized protein n=1 Tax=Puccinia coronata f. sp. avenae TaxID=200324 RepID=A0A2N5V212_9BASI|nr:hypothetical protein PCANC_19067 [Puccinia coronata f. sp. avenae]PLW43936.1 hypothetical protein PCASD_06475 [Puccinia coronata f. sp. avenae]